jgi:hypothetical protein
MIQSPVHTAFSGHTRSRLVLLVIAFSIGCGKQAEPAKPVGTSMARFSLRGDLPNARPSNFVGSDACRECHAAISDSFAKHPMGKSIGTPDQVETIETYPSGPIDIAGQRRYRVEDRDGVVTHHEYVVSPDGEVAFDQAEPISFAVGSGQRGRAYLIFKDGVFRQSPIGWYSTDDRWDLSPGYTPDKHQRFQRRVGDGCLYCHAGQVDSTGHDRYAEKPFVEASISCERCHGPGEDHIAFHRSGPGKDRSLDPIVNPDKLSVSARESVCNQCHLQGNFTIPRYGRSFNDFRPGDEMEDIFVCLVNPPSTRDGEPSRVVSQVEQMRTSQCYIQSQSQLGCTSCHDPHAPAPSENRDRYYADRCNACHSDRGCSLPPAEQQAAPASGSCIHCHMPADTQTNVPHTAQTDHRILRQPIEKRTRSTKPMSKSLSDKGQSTFRIGSKSLAIEELQVFGNAKQIPTWEQSRAIGIAMMTQAWQTEDLELARQAITKLIPATTIQAGPDAMIAALTPDIPALNEVASYLWLTDNPEAAAKCWMHILELAPDDETALSGMVLASRRFGDAKEATRYVDQVLRITPESPQWLTQKTKLLWEQEQFNEAFETAEKLLRADPTLIELRRWLAESYREKGKSEQADVHEQTIKRLTQSLK